jgi:hypothetical protein
MVFIVVFIGYKPTSMGILVVSWLLVWNMIFMTFHILGMSSSQLTFIFFRGVETTNQ